MVAAKKSAKKTTRASKTTTADRFKRLGLEVDADFIVHLPLRYEDETRIHSINAARNGQFIQIEGVVTQQSILPGPRRQLLAMLEDQTGQIRLRWLHFYPNLLKTLEEGAFVRARGEVRSGFHGLELIHPKITKAGQPLAERLTPIYPTTDGLRQNTLADRIKDAFTRINLQDTLPEHVRERYQLAPFDRSLYTLHHPPSGSDQQALLDRRHPAWQRIKFDELLAQQLSLAAARDARRAQRSYVLNSQPQALVQQLQASLSFQLTAAQTRVVNEILADLHNPYPMHRLLQGDVGSGKTIVAALAAAQVVAQGYQVAIMAPTEILAEQHFLKFQAWFEPLGVTVHWLSGSKTAKQRQPVLEALGNGEAKVVIGTQALIQEGVHFHNLALVILDEQHRFGVGQRLTLSQKGEDERTGAMPHQLSMSATPIPRTLAMSFLADLDVSIIDELPAGRKAIITKLIADARRDEILQHIAKQVAEGGQVYWVCPLVEESEALQLQTAVDTQLYLADHLPGVSVGLVHGKLKAAEKAAVMDAFRLGAVDVLVATTVIEVGVDVPNANLMVIEHAERFGLAQLHQLRGRVGRGGAQAICVLLYQGQLSFEARERLRAMHETNDGFEIAKRDLALRGPGEFLGIRQSGQALLRFADLQTDEAMIHKAQDCARELREHHPDAVVAHLERWLRGRENYLRS